MVTRGLLPAKPVQHQGLAGKVGELARAGKGGSALACCRALGQPCTPTAPHLFAMMTQPACLPADCCSKKGMVRANLLYAMRMKEVPGQPGRTRMQVGGGSGLCGLPCRC